MHPASQLLSFAIATIVLAVAFWLVRIFVAPTLFFAMPPSLGGALAFAVFILLAPLLVAVPGGIAYALMSGGRSLRASFAVAFVAASLVAGFAIAASAMSRGLWWVTPLEALSFVGLFVAVVFVVSRLTARSSGP